MRAHIKPRPARNPVALPARQRKAGPHEKTVGGKRREAKDSLQRAVHRGRYEDLDR